MEVKDFYKSAITLGQSIRDGVYGMQPTGFSAKLREFTKEFTGKELFISVKPIADWINCDYSRELSIKYKKYFETNEIVIGTTSQKIKPEDAIAYMSDRIYQDGISELAGYPRPNITLRINGSQLVQMNGAGQFKYNGIDVVFRPNDFNKLASFKFGEKELQMPFFYKAPHEDITDLKTILKETKGTTRTLYSAEVSNDGTANLAIIAETDTTITYNIMSLAGLYFVKEVLDKHIKAEKKDWDAYAENEAFRNLADTILSRKKSTVDNCRTLVRERTRDLTEAHRELKTNLLMLEVNNKATIIKDMIRKIQKEAKIDPMIKRIMIMNDGKFGAVVGPLKLAIYRKIQTKEEEKENGQRFGTYTQYQKSPKRYEAIERNLGLVDIKLEGGGPIIRTRGNNLIHPHVGSAGNMCTGSGGDLYASLLGRLEIVSTIRLVFSLLARYNPDSPLNRIRSIESYPFIDPQKEVKEYADYKYIYKINEEPKDGNYLYEVSV